MNGDNGEVGKESVEERDLVLTVTLKADGGMQVAGPGNGQMFDEPMCFWMLDKAKDFIKSRNFQTLKSNLYIPDRLRRV